MNNAMVVGYTTNTRNHIVPPHVIINNENWSYDREGETCMDKNKTANTVEYQYENNVVTVERHFTNNRCINDIVKKYVFEQHKNFVLHKSTEKCYDSNSNTTVVDFSEGRNK